MTWQGNVMLAYMGKDDEIFVYNVYKQSTTKTIILKGLDDMKKENLKNHYVGIGDIIQLKDGTIVIQVGGDMSSVFVINTHYETMKFENRVTTVIALEHDTFAVGFKDKVQIYNTQCMLLHEIDTECETLTPLSDGRLVTASMESIIVWNKHYERKHELTFKKENLTIHNPPTIWELHRNELIIHSTNHFHKWNLYSNKFEEIEPKGNHFFVSKFGTLYSIQEISKRVWIENCTDNIKKSVSSEYAISSYWRGGAVEMEPGVLMWPCEPNIVVYDFRKDEIIGCYNLGSESAFDVTVRGYLLE